MANILITKETRAEESRVAIIPSDAKKLVSKGHKIYIEHHAGKTAGFDDTDYKNVGAEIRYIDDSSSIDGFKKLFNDINMVIRVKRPDRRREILENKALSTDTIMIGALDPLEKNSSHIREYNDAGIIAYSIDQLNLKSDHPMNVLAAMSKIAGKLALRDAIDKFHSKIKKVVIVGFGVVGHSAFDEAVSKKLSTTVILNNNNHVKEVITKGGQVLLLEKNVSLEYIQNTIKNALVDADIVITSARKANQPAPLLIPLTTLQQMNKGSVIVDMALSEGGNVEGSEHDKNLILGNGIIVTNTSGYPKALPHDASRLWSAVSLLFILKLIENNNKFVPV